MNLNNGYRININGTEKIFCYGQADNDLTIFMAFEK